MASQLKITAIEHTEEDVDDNDDFYELLNNAMTDTAARNILQMLDDARPVLREMYMLADLTDDIYTDHLLQYGRKDDVLTHSTTLMETDIHDMKKEQGNIC